MQPRGTGSTTQGINPPQSFHEKERNHHDSAHIASSCDQNQRTEVKHHDSTSSKPQDEDESYTPRGVQEFFCLVEFFSVQDQNHKPRGCCGCCGCCGFLKHALTGWNVYDHKRTTTMQVTETNYTWASACALTPTPTHIGHEDAMKEFSEFQVRAAHQGTAS